MYINFNPNPKGNRVGDCTVRACCKATGADWEIVFAGLSAIGFELCDMPSANFVWGAYLRRHGFKRYLIHDTPDIYTVAEFAADNPQGIFVLAIQGHVVCVVDGDWYDSWDSANEVPLYYWRK